jgi:hypothetical protein
VIFWLGGGSGAGKTTVARAVAGRLDLRIYPIDGYTYAHYERALHGGYPLMARVARQTAEQRRRRAPAELAESFVANAAERLRMVRADLAALGEGPDVIVEGPQLFPELVAPLLESPRHGLWLLPTPDFARRAVALRFHEVPDALEARYERDVLLTALNRRQAAEHGLSVVDVDGGAGPEAVADLVSGVLAGLPGLRRAASGAERQRIRIAENAVAVRQLLAWWDDAIGRDRLPDGPVYAFSCECDTLGCARQTPLPVTRYIQQSAAGPVT